MVSICPLAESMVNFDESAPSRVYVSVSLSASVAVTTAPMCVVVKTASSTNVSLKLRVSEAFANTGAVLDGLPVDPDPAVDQGLSPSLFVARTCTWYEVPAVRLPMLALVPVWSCGPSVQPVSPTSR